MPHQQNAFRRETSSAGRVDFPVWLTVIAIAALSLAINLAFNDFALFLHGDEPKKVRFVLGEGPDFNHPILMIMVGRLANGIAGYTEPQAVIELMRTVSAAFGALTVVATFLLARRVMPVGYALLAALALAVCPTFVVHAHYCKEDVFFVPFAILSLWAYLRLDERPDRWRAAWLGIFFGLALATQYKAALLIGVFAAHAMLSGQAGAALNRLKLRLALPLGVVLALLVNFEMFTDPMRFVRGITFETQHIVIGHTLRLYPLDHWFSFHLTHSVIPGLTLAVTLAGLAGLLWTVLDRSLRRRDTLLLAMYTAAFYFAHELSPTKPAPDYMRYMIPIAPVLIIFAVHAVRVAVERMPRLSRNLRPAVAVAVIAAGVIAYPAAVSARLVANLVPDTRVQAARWLAEHNANPLAEHYGLPDERGVIALPQVDIDAMRDEGVTHLVASSFIYGRYALGATLSGQRDDIYEYAAWYERLFTQPYVEFAPAYRSFGFSNPVVRVFDIDQVDWSFVDASG